MNLNMYLLAVQPEKLYKTKVFCMQQKNFALVQIFEFIRSKSVTLWIEMLVSQMIQNAFIIRWQY